MEKKLKGFLIILGALIMGSVTLTPLTSYAAEGECSKDNPSACLTTTKNAQVNVNVRGSLTLDSVETTEYLKVTAGQPKDGTLKANVSSTGAFTILLSADEPNLVNTVDSNSVIPSTSNTNDAKGWAIQKIGETSYSALTSTPTVFYTGPSNNNVSKPYSFSYRVWVDNAVKEGMYSTEVTVTAAIKE